MEVATLLNIAIPATIHIIMLATTDLANWRISIKLVALDRYIMPAVTKIIPVHHSHIPDIASGPQPTPCLPVVPITTNSNMPKPNTIAPKIAAYKLPNLDFLFI